MKLRLKISIWLALLFALPLQAQVSPSQYDFARPSLNWYTLETEHFNILFHADADGEGSSRSAQAVALIAEEVYGPITELYAHRPNSRVSIIVKDYEDYSNGAAYFFDNKIEIWSPALDVPLRGDHDWLRNVIAHEFTHIVQVQAAMGVSRGLPLGYLQILNYENAKRPDVLSGYPNVIVSYPVVSLNNPAWFAEGTAQYQRETMDYDRWDSHRDMMLRSRVLAGETLSLVEMGGFYSKSSLMREGVYNHGFAFTRYLANTRGEKVLRDITWALGRWRNWNVERAMDEALGRPAAAVYAAWMDTLGRSYAQRTRAIREHIVEGSVIEEAGFANYGPTFSPDGKRLAFVSNQGQHFSRTSLFVYDLAQESALTYDLGKEQPVTHTCAFGHRLRKGVGRSVTWRPDGEAVVYVRKRPTAEGYLYDDLYELALHNKKETRLTRHARAAQPSYAPDGASIAFVRQKDGTTNLYVLRKTTGHIEPLTAYDNGTQVSDPAWHPAGEWVYFARRVPGAHERDIWRLHVGTRALEAVVATPADERSPAFGSRGEALHYASDRSGIFNLYRQEGGRPMALTNVLGGAFMPSVGADGSIAYAHYRWDGYKIALLGRPVAVDVPVYLPPSVLLKKAAKPARPELEDMPARASERAAHERAEGGRAPATDSLAAERYGMTTTGFSFFPVLRLDQYVSRRRSVLGSRLPDLTRAETLARNIKVGTYVASREILEGVTLFGGLLLGPGSREASSVPDFFSPSRLFSLERDAFLIFDYRKGLGLIPRRWSPQLSVEMFNIRRHVKEGLSIEEFPCTACFPDTSRVDLTYALWEADLHARSKISEALLLEAGYRYSPYRVVTERFFSREAQQAIPSSSSRYFIGRTLLATAYLEFFHAHRDGDMYPLGVRLELGFENERGRLLRRFDLEEGILKPVYERDRFIRLTLQGIAGIGLPGRVRGAGHGMAFRWHVSNILGKAVDDFYDDYVGGLSGARGYPFYALGGNETLWAQASYFLPLFPDIRQQLLWIYVDKAFLRVYADAAAAWTGGWPGFRAMRKDIGVELRLKLGSYYLLPTSIFLSTTYGLDAFELELDEDFVTASGQRFVRYGSEFQWHFGVLFGFDV